MHGITKLQSSSSLFYAVMLYAILKNIVPERVAVGYL